VETREHVIHEPMREDVKLAGLDEFHHGEQESDS
jgi:hypothetical protein